MDTKIGSQREITRAGGAQFVIYRRDRHITRMPLIFSKIRCFAPLGLTAVALAGCSRMSDVSFDAKLALGSVSLVDRCSDFMHRAFPETPIDVAGSRVSNDAQNATVTIDGVREGVPASGAYARNVAVECRFEGGILTGFRWLAGPVRPATTGQAP